MATPKSVGNLIGEPFEDYVNNQIIRRQIIQGKPERSLDEIQYLSNRNAWIKLASGVSIERERLNLLKKNGNSLITDANITTGKDLAINYVLFNGLSNFEGKKPLQRSGVKNLSNNPNPVYGVGGTDFGYSPMPGITDMEFRCLNRGSIKKATLNIKAHNREQFDIIDVLYLRLGYSVFIEWGYDKYIDNKGKLQQMNETLIDNKFWSSKYNKSDYSEWLPEIDKKREETDGNYDGAFGTVSNFSWTFNRDGSYDIKVEIISLGDIVESLRVNLPVVSPPSISPFIAANFQNALVNAPITDFSEKKFYDVLYNGLDKVIDDWFDNAPNSSVAPNINMEGISADLTMAGYDPTSVKSAIPSARVNDYSGFDSYVNPLGISFPDFKVTPEIIKNSIEFALINSHNKTGAFNYTSPLLTPKKVLSNSGNLTSQYDNQSYGFFGSNFSVENIKTEGEEFWKNSTYYDRIYSLTDKILNPQQVFIENSDGKTDTVIVSLLPIPKSNSTKNNLLGLDNIKVGVSQSSISDQAPDLVRTVTSGYSFIQNPNFSFALIVSSVEGKKYRFPKNRPKGKIQTDFVLNDGASNLRKIWNDNYLSASNSERWNYLLNCIINNPVTNNPINFSPTKADLKTGVYQFFRQQGLARPDPSGITAVATSNPENLSDDDLVFAKDFQNKNRNRIYRFFYDIRTLNKNSTPNKFITDTLPPNFNFETGVELFQGFPIGSFIKNNSGENVIISLDDIQPSTQQYFIRFDYFLDFLEKQIIPIIQSTNTSLIKFDGIAQNVKDKTICYVLDNIISLDLNKLIISNPFFIRGIDTNDSPVSQPIFPQGLSSFIKTIKGGDRLFWGEIMNIYFNFTRLEEIFSSNSTTDPVMLFEALKTLCDDINDALGGINNIEPVVDEKNKIRFIDQTPIPGINQIANFLGIKYILPSSEEATLEIYGYNKSNPNKEQTSNFVTNIGITTQIDKNYATMITIGATANGGVPGIEATAFSKWNVGIEDRFKNNLLDPADDTSSSIPFTGSISYINTQEIYTTFLNQNAALIGLNEDRTINEEYITFNKKAASNWYKTMQIANSIKDEGYTESSIGFLPFNLKIDMDGLSGIKIYNRVQVNTAFLPSNYPETLEFIITQVNHKLNANGWSTSLETIATAKNKRV